VTTLQEITRGDIQRESLFVADDCNHVQWIRESALMPETAEPGRPHEGPCGSCSFPENARRQWRRVYVQV
jgi:hypothetical protein